MPPGIRRSRNQRGASSRAKWQPNTWEFSGAGNQALPRGENPQAKGVVQDSIPLLRCVNGVSQTVVAFPQVKSPFGLGCVAARASPCVKPVSTPEKTCPEQDK